jgi:hypothetical protein
MKKPLIFLIASLALVVAGGALAFLYSATPKTDQANDVSAINATVTQKCQESVKKLYKTTASLAIETCTIAYNLEIKKNDAADDFCRNLNKNGNFTASQLNSICGMGQRLADADRAAGTPASSGGSSSTSGSPSSGGSSSRSSSSTTSTGGSAPTAKKTQSTKEVKDPPDETTCKDGKGVKLGTAGLGTKCVGDSNTNPIYALLQVVSKWLIGLLGLVFVLIVVISGFQYIVSRGNPDETKSAKGRLEHAVIGIVLLVLMTAILNTLIPGGIL